MEKTAEKTVRVKPAVLKMQNEQLGIENERLKQSLSELAVRYEDLASKSCALGAKLNTLISIIQTF